jgi:hypothetical protein
MTAEPALRQAAAQAGFAAEGLDLLLPAEPAALGALGPRITDEVMIGLRRLTCPTGGGPAAASHAVLSVSGGQRSIPAYTTADWSRSAAACWACWASPGSQPAYANGSRSQPDQHRDA